MAKNKTFLIVVTIVATVVTFILSRILWPDAAGAMMPSSAQLPFLIIVSAFESLGFGIGLAFLISLWPSMKGRGTGDWLAVLSAAWLLMSWWPHDNFHRTMPMGDFWQLIRLEWGFHVTLIAAGVIVASVLWKKFATESHPTLSI